MGTAITTETRKTTIDDLTEKLQAGVAQLQDSDRFKAWLTFQASFHTYSWANALLIHLQKPGATRVMGFNQWKKLGRSVRKGEKGIAIRAPMYKTFKGTSEDGEEVERRRTFFGVVYVFDVSQTDGEPLPTIAPLLTGDAPDFLWSGLRGLAHEEGIVLDTEQGEVKSADDVAGWYRPGDKKDRTAEWAFLSKPQIVVQKADRAQMVKTLAHELAHHYHHTHYSGAEATRAAGETIAEAVAYIVCSRFGLDTSDRSFGYLATWSGRGGIETVLPTIQKIAATMIEYLEKNAETITAAA